ncbi:MAG: beta-N-acetylhexosaminidase [Dehalococcoidia bacterium]|nr:MAG: beta-N-acetylhexosaminidase [Dehalococcoidia bacterium]
MQGRAALVVGILAALLLAWTPVAASELDFEFMVHRVVARMTLEEKVGQLIIAGIPGTRPEDGGLELVRRLHLGGVVYLASNVDTPAQVRALSEGLQRGALAGLPLFVAIDHEGGLVMRLREPVTQLPDPMAIGATGDPALARQAGAVAAAELLALGINFNLAPVLDVNDTPANPVIGRRSFGDRPSEVAAFGVAYLEGLQAGGVLASGKHFPGHGHADTDSHVALPVIDRSLGWLTAIDLTPFRAAIAANVATIMTAHVIYPALDPDRPATLSPAILRTLLRDRLGFNGPILTDALGMAAISAEYSPGEAAVRSLQAGADVALLVDGAEEVHSALVAAVRNGRLPLASVDESARRVVRLKLRYRDRWAAPPPLSVIGSPAHLAVADEIGRRAVTVVRDRDGWLPLALGSRVLVVRPTLLPSGERGLAAALRRAGAGEALEITVALRDAESKALAREEALAAAPRYDAVIVATHWADPWSGPGSDPAWQRETIEALRATGVPVIVAATGDPYDLASFPDVPAYLVTYGATPAQLQGLADRIFGRTPPNAVGRLPVALPPEQPRFP